MKKEDLILDYLMHGNDLTTLSCQRLFHTSELRHYIARLRKRNYGIIGQWKTESDGYRFKRYFIAQKSKHEESPEDRQADRNFCGSFSGYSVNPFRERAE